MKIKLFLTYFFVIFYHIINAQTLFQKTFGTSASESGYIVNQTRDNGYIIATQLGYIVKTDSLGNIIWSENINYPYLTDISQTHDDGYIICGDVYYSYTYSIMISYVIKLDSSGNIVWQQAYKSDYAKYLSTIREDIDGTGYIMAGRDYSDNLLFMKINLTGNTVWAKIMKPNNQPGKYPTPCGFVQLNADSSFLLLSTYRYGGTKEGILLSKISKNGNGLWTKTLITSEMWQYWPFHGMSIKKTYNGNIMIGGYMGGNADFLELDTSGTPVTNAIRYTSINTDLSWDFAEPTINNTIYLSYSTFEMIPDIVLIKSDLTGNIAWSKKIGGINTENSGKVIGGNDKSAVVTGKTRSFSVGLDDIFLIKTDSLGTFVCNSENYFYSDPVQFPIATDSNFNSTFSSININKYPLDFTVTNSMDTSYDACICVAPQAAFSTGFPYPSEEVTDSSTWASMYIWDNGNGQIDTSIYFSPYYPVDGIYTICLKVTNACGSDSVCHPINYLTINVSETDLNSNLMVEIYPNPFTASTIIDFGRAINNVELNIFNTLGQKMKQINNISGPSINLYRDNLPSGVYFIRMTQDNKIFKIDKLVITD